MKVLLLVGCLLLSCAAHARSCPSGSVPSKVDSNYCCKGSYTEGGVDGKSEWGDFSPRLCGCPNGGTLVHEDYDNRVCCKNNLRYDYWELGEEYFYKLNHNGKQMPAEMRHTDKYDILDAKYCGCPKGLQLSKDKTECCLNGYGVRGQGSERKEFYAPETCGCPDGGQFKVPKDGGVACIKNNYQYDYLKTKKYVWVDAEEWGCPEGSEQKGTMCCKGGYAYSNHTFKFDKVDGYCGCPDGGKISENYKKDKYLHPCCKGEYMYNPKTKRYDRKNKTACNAAAAKKMAESYVRSLEKHANKRGVDPFIDAAAENRELMQEVGEIGQFYSDVPEMY